MCGRFFLLKYILSKYYSFWFTYLKCTLNVKFSIFYLLLWGRQFKYLKYFIGYEINIMYLVPYCTSYKSKYKLVLYSNVTLKHPNRCLYFTWQSSLLRFVTMYNIKCGYIIIINELKCFNDFFVENWIQQVVVNIQINSSEIFMI